MMPDNISLKVVPVCHVGSLEVQLLLGVSLKRQP